MKHRTYFLVLQGLAGSPADCYRVPKNGGPVTREVTYRLMFMEEGMPAPMGYSAVISEHLKGDIPVTGADSESSSAPGWFPDQHSVLMGNDPQNVSQRFTAEIDGVQVGLPVVGAFGGGDPVELSIVKHRGYVSINGDIGGKIDDDGKLIKGTYRECN